MKAKSGESGMTLMEMLTVTMILSILVAAMGTGMATAMQTYEISLFQAESAMVSDILNTAMADLLRFSQVTETEEGFWISNGDYGIPGGEICESDGYLCVRSGGEESLLVNEGTYGALRVKDFSCSYFPDGDGNQGGFFRIHYSLTDGNRSRSVETAVRPLNEFTNKGN